MKNRLKRNSDFDKVFKKGKRGFSKSLLLIYIPSDSLKIGLSVSKKHGKAVTRNKIKRLLRAAIGKIEDRLGKYHIVILPKVAVSYDYSAFLSDLEKIAVKENLINDNK